MISFVLSVVSETMQWKICMTSASHGTVLIISTRLETKTRQSNKRQLPNCNPINIQVSLPLICRASKHMSLISIGEIKSNYVEVTGSSINKAVFSPPKEMGQQVIPYNTFQVLEESQIKALKQGKLVLCKWKSYIILV